MCIQIPLTIAFGTFVYVVFAVMVYYDGIISLIGLPIIGTIFSTLCTLALLVLGLPLRFYKPLKNWWLCHPKFPIILFVISIVFLVVSWNSSLTILVPNPEFPELPKIPSANPYFASIGYGLSLFSILHFFPLAIKREVLEKKID